MRTTECSALVPCALTPTTRRSRRGMRPRRAPRVPRVELLSDRGIGNGHHATGLGDGVVGNELAFQAAPQALSRTKARLPRLGAQVTLRKRREGMPWAGAARPRPPTISACLTHGTGSTHGSQRLVIISSDRADQFERLSEASVHRTNVQVIADRRRTDRSAQCASLDRAATRRPAAGKCR